MLTANDFTIRDPFILPVPEEGAYYLYGTVNARMTEGGHVCRFLAYRTEDLVHFEEGKEVFSAHKGFWSNQNFWAPEVHKYNGKYYMFASFKAKDVNRGTQILVSDTPGGTFVPISDGPVTPREWECLDGTLYIDEDGKPYIVFCHEWVQIHDGTVCAMPLSDDLIHAIGAPVTLFSASEPKWAPKGKQDYVTDGPFVFRMADGTLSMLWSSFPEGGNGYAQVLATSPTGNINGPWVQRDTPLFSLDGGHGMLFTTFEGQLTLTLHAPNAGPERVCFFPVKEEYGTLVLQ